MIMASSKPKEKSQSHGAGQGLRALATIGFGSIVMDSEVGSTSDDEPNSSQNVPPDDAHSLIGFSIGHEQTRLASPQTPAAEKAAALGSGDGFFDNSEVIADHGYTEEPGEIENTDKRNVAGDKQLEAAERQSRELPQFGEWTSHTTSAQRLPSPWRSTPRTFERSDPTGAAMHGVREGGRKRASTGPIEFATDTIKRFWPSLPSLSSFPSLPKSPSLFNFSLPSLPNPLSSGHARDFEQAAHPPVSRARRHSSPLRNLNPESNSASNGRSAVVDPKKSVNGSQIPSLQSARIYGPSEQSVSHRNTGEQGLGSQTRASVLRRTTSDESLRLQRTISRVSSLGDDNRFAHISEQSNSRLRAIKDSWQDSNLRLPNISISNFSFGSSRPDIYSPGPNGRIASNLKSRSHHPKSLSLNSSRTMPRNFDNSPDTTNFTPDPPKSGVIAGMSAATHPYFTQALEELEGDLVIMGGYRGSVLRSAEPPNRQLWVPIKVGLNLRKVDLQVGLEPEDEESMEERIKPDGMLTHIGPVDISRRLFKRLRASANAKTGKLRVWDYGYDWRLSPHILSRKLIEYLEKLPSNQANYPKEKRGALVIAHSLGGLVTRHAVNKRPELFSGVVYAGVPTSCVNILGPLRAGDDVLFSSRVLTAQVNFTIRTSYALLPLDGTCFVDKDTKEEYPVDFFDVNTWIDNCLTPVLAPPLPALSPTTNGPIEGLIGSMSNALASVSIPLRKGTLPRRRSPSNSFSNSNSSSTTTMTSDSTTVKHHTISPHENVADRSANNTAHATGVTPQLNSAPTHTLLSSLSPTDPTLSSLSPIASPTAPHSPSTTITLPRPAAIAYLARTLAETKLFKSQLSFHQPHATANCYPPHAVIFGKTTPTVSRARVAGRDGIRRADAYDDLAFASGDGVVLARASMLPEGYSTVRGGCVSSERGHVTLLGDLEAVGKCLVRVMKARRRGFGLGEGEGSEE